MKEQSRPGTTSKAGRWITGLVAALLLLGAVNKVVDPVTALGHMPFALARPLQLGTVLALEVCAALALLLFPSRRAIWLSAVLLTAFSAYLLHLIHAGAASCGCFDSLGIERSPRIALATNLAAIGGLFYALRRTQPRTWTGSEAAMCLGLAVLSVTFACATTRVPKHLALEQLLGSQAAGRDILLKISPACDACLQTTRQVLSDTRPPRDCHHLCQRGTRQPRLHGTISYSADRVRCAGVFRPGWHAGSAALLSPPRHPAHRLPNKNKP